MLCFNLYKKFMDTFFCCIAVALVCFFIAKYVLCEENTVQEFVGSKIDTVLQRIKGEYDIHMWRDSIFEDPEDLTTGQIRAYDMALVLTLGENDTVLYVNSMTANNSDNIASISEMRFPLLLNRLVPENRFISYSEFVAKYGHWMSSNGEKVIDGDSDQIDEKLQTIHGEDNRMAMRQAILSCLKTGRVNDRLPEDVDADENLPLFAALKLNDENLVANLLAAKINLNVVDGDEGDTPLHVAVDEYSVNNVISLVNAGCSMNIKNRCGLTPLHKVILCSGNPCTMNALLDLGADATIPDNKGRTPLHILATEFDCDLSMYDSFVKHNTDINIRDMFEKTPLHYAARHNANPIVIFKLRQLNADFQAKDTFSQTPLDVVKHNPNAESIRCALKLAPKLTKHEIDIILEGKWKP